MVSNSDLMREAWKEYLCISDHPERRDVTILGRNAGWCPPEMLEPFEALSQALTKTGYQSAFSVWVPRNCPIGIGGRTCRDDGTDCSLHNYGVAVDIDPPNPSNKEIRDGSANPIFGEKGHWSFGDIKLTDRQVDTVRAIRTKGGDQLFGWLGDSSINDTMHFEVRVPPAATRVDWRTVPGRRKSIPVNPGVGDGKAATYVVQRNDELGLIVARFGVTTSELIAVNPQILDPDRIFPGDVLTLPGRDSERRRIRRRVSKRTYIVQDEDSMVKIAARFEIATIELIAANPQISDPKLIFAGQVLKIPRPGDASPG